MNISDAWKSDPIAQARSWQQQVTRATEPSLDYRFTLDRFAEDFQQLAKHDDMPCDRNRLPGHVEVPGLGSLKPTPDGLEMNVNRNHAQVHFVLKNDVMEVSEERLGRHMEFKLNPQNGTITDFSDVDAATPLADGPKLDDELRLPVSRQAFPELFHVLGVEQDKLELTSRATISEDKFEKHLNRLRPNYSRPLPDPVLARIFFTEPGSQDPVRSLEVVRMAEQGMVPDNADLGGPTMLVTRRWDGYTYPGIGSHNYVDPQDEIASGASVLGMNKSLQQLGMMREANPEHAALHNFHRVIHLAQRRPGVELP